jgi:uncharacterized protein YqiB (DUF1249 family)
MGYLNPINKSICLEQICESNFQKLFQLIPCLLTCKEKASGFAENNSFLHLDVIERSPYTITIELSHSFSKSGAELLEPAVKIRIYLDAKLAEVLSDHVRAPVMQIYKNASCSREIMNYKWRLNYFLQKWLDHCLKKNYCFTHQFIKIPTVSRPATS